MNEKGKNQVIYIFLFLALVWMLGCSWTKYQDENSLIVVYADEVVEFEPIIITPTPMPEEEKVEDYLEDLHDLPDNAVDVAKEIAKVFKEDTYMAIRVAHCESRLRQDRIHTNTGGSKDVGLFQINQKWHADKGDAYDFHENIRVAKKIFDSSGWYPWVCYNLYSHGW